MKITGIGLVTPLGATAPQTWAALLAGRFIINHARALDAPDRPERVIEMAHRAAAEAVERAQWRNRQSGVGRTALVVGTSKGPVETWLNAPPALSDVGCTYGLSALALSLRQRLAMVDGPAITLSAACASGLHALARAAMMIQSREAERVLVVAAEASVHPLFLGSFKRLGVLPRGGVGCRPYDQTRNGFLMSEAAAAVCLEGPESPVASRTSASVVSPESAPLNIRLERYALAGDATHMTGIDPDAAALRYLLRRVVDRRPVDLIHGHGTGTAMNDPLELAAFEDHCSGHDHTPIIYSHKGALGHSLGAAGLVSVVLNCMMHRVQHVPPNVQTRQPLATKRLHIAREGQPVAIRRSVAVAAGFGGPMAAVSLISP
jgi:3-oxoacyl-[acyl-carrier-protein] synthase II